MPVESEVATCKREIGRYSQLLAGSQAQKRAVVTDSQPQARLGSFAVRLRICSSRPSSPISRPARPPGRDEILSFSSLHPATWLSFLPSFLEDRANFRTRLRSKMGIPRPDLLGWKGNQSSHFCINPIDPSKPPLLALEHIHASSLPKGECVLTEPSWLCGFLRHFRFSANCGPAGRRDEGEYATQALLHSFCRTR